MPVRGDNNVAIGSFALSGFEERQPSPFHMKLLEVCADIVTIVIKRQAEGRKLSHLAHYDVLTQLPNRTLFIDRFNQAVAHCQRTQTMLAVCFLDLDDFKLVNDNFGHDVGDKLLLMVADRIKDNMREEDTASRQGGDEFTLLFRDIESYAQCEHTINRIHKALKKPYLIDGISHTISASSGLTLYPIDDGDIDTLMRHADQAMYHAKQSGRNQYSLFNTELDEKVTLKHHQLSEVEHALAQNELQLYFQPKVNMTTGKVFGAEALIRWIHPERGLIPPLDFLPLVEGTDLELKIGQWVIEQSFQQLNSWNQQGIELEVSINISSRHLLSADFYTELENTLARYPAINSQHIQLEILESTALGDIHAITSVLKLCQNSLGIQVALDDFGTGYSSLTHLRNLPANIVKIDQNFVRDMLDDPNDYVIIDGVIGLASSFNRKVIAEGVETTSHGLMLLIMGCEQAQGYGIAKPMPAAQLTSWLDNYSPNPAWLDFGAQNHSEKNNKLNLFKLTSQQWLNNFLNNARSPHQEIEVWPIMNNKHCHCAYWIKRARQDHLFKPKLLKRLDAAHEKLHVIANSILIKYQARKLKQDDIELKQLQQAFDDMYAVLDL
jgi:diguanylate cyclase (GGDEF)-like protein